MPTTPIILPPVYSDDPTQTSRNELPIDATNPFALTEPGTSTCGDSAVASDVETLQTVEAGNLAPGTYVDTETGALFSPGMSSITLPPPPGAVMLTDGGEQRPDGTIVAANGNVVFDPANPRTNLFAMVEQTFIDTLGREGLQAGVDEWVNEAQTMRANGLSDAEIQFELDRAFQETSEFRSKQIIQSVYQEVLGRDGEASGVNAWHDVVLGLRAEGYTNYDIKAYLAEQFKVSDEGLSRIMVDTYRTVANAELHPAQLPGMFVQVAELRDSGLTAAEISSTLAERYGLTDAGLRHIVEEAHQEVFGRAAQLDELQNGQAHATNLRDQALTSDQIRADIVEQLSQSDEALVPFAREAWFEATGDEVHIAELRGLSDDINELRDQGLSAAEIRARLNENYSVSDAGLLHMVRNTYESVLGRTGEAEGVAAWAQHASQLRDQGQGGERIAAHLSEQFALSLEGLTKTVHATYADVLGREGEPSGVENWVAQAVALKNGGATAGQIEAYLAEQFSISPEGLTLTVQQTYRDVLGREGEASGVENWVEQAKHLSSQGYNASQIALYLDDQFRLSDEGLARSVIASVGQALEHADPAAITYYVTQAHTLRAEGKSADQIDAKITQELGIQRLRDLAYSESADGVLYDADNHVLYDPDIGVMPRNAVDVSGMYRLANGEFVDATTVDPTTTDATLMADGTYAFSYGESASDFGASGLVLANGDLVVDAGAFIGADGSIWSWSDVETGAVDPTHLVRTEDAIVITKQGVLVSSQGSFALSGEPPGQGTPLQSEGGIVRAASVQTISSDGDDDELPFPTLPPLADSATFKESITTSFLGLGAYIPSLRNDQSIAYTTNGDGTVELTLQASSGVGKHAGGGPVNENFAGITAGFEGETNVVFEDADAAEAFIDNLSSYQTVFEEAIEANRGVFPVSHPRSGINPQNGLIIADFINDVAGHGDVMRAAEAVVAENLTGEITHGVNVLIESKATVNGVGGDTFFEANVSLAGRRGTTFDTATGNTTIFYDVTVNGSGEKGEGLPFGSYKLGQNNVGGGYTISIGYVVDEDGNVLGMKVVQELVGLRPAEIAAGGHLDPSSQLALLEQKTGGSVTIGRRVEIEIPASEFANGNSVDVAFAALSRDDSLRWSSTATNFFEVDGYSGATLGHSKVGVLDGEKHWSTAYMFTGDETHSAAGPGDANGASESAPGSGSCSSNNDGGGSSGSSSCGSTSSHDTPRSDSGSSCGEHAPPPSTGASSCGEQAPPPSTGTSSCGEHAPPPSTGTSSCGEQAPPAPAGSSSCGEHTPPPSTGSSSCGEQAPPPSTGSSSCGEQAPPPSTGSSSCGEQAPPASGTSSCGEQSSPPTSGSSTCGESTPPPSPGGSTCGG